MALYLKNKKITNMKVLSNNIKTITQEEITYLLKSENIDLNSCYNILDAINGIDILDNIDYSILNAGIYTIDANNQFKYNPNIELVDGICELSNSTNIKQMLIISNNDIIKFTSNSELLDFLIIYNCNNLQKIYLNNCSICNNEYSLLKLGENLNNRENSVFGSIIITNQEIRKKVEYKFIEKDWYFGSPILFNNEELSKCQKHLIDTGVLDIWESAEYGEGVRIGIIDSGLPMDLKEINYNNMIGYKNLSEHHGTSSDPLPTIENRIHGACVTSVIVGQGVKYYGIAPKASFGFVKIGEIDSTAYNYTQIQAPIWCRENQIDIANCSYDSEISTLNYTKYHIGSLHNYIDYKNSVSEGFVNFSSGNDGNELLNYYKIPGSTTLSMLSSGYCYDENNNTKFYTVSSIRNGIMFMGCTGVIAEYKSDQYDEFWGTSCSAPVNTGMMTLGINLFKKKCGYKPNQKQLVDFLKYRTSTVNSEVIDYKKQGYGIINFKAYNSSPENDSNIKRYEV